MRHEVAHGGERGRIGGHNTQTAKDTALPRGRLRLQRGLVVRGWVCRGARSSDLDLLKRN